MLFRSIEETRFPIERVVPIVEYNWSDEKSMQDNNTSSFNYCFLSGSKIFSMHASGLSIDINPKQNPYMKNGSNSPAGSVYELDVLVRRGVVSCFFFFKQKTAYEFLF